MKKHYVLTYLLFAFFLTRGLSQPAESTDIFRSIDSLLTDEYDLLGPGVAVLASQDGEVVFEKSYGLADIESQRELSTDMVFQIGSMTKQFTSVAVLQLVEAGKVQLDEPIQTYLPYFPTKEHTITIHHLLSQTSGIPEFFDVDEDEFAILYQKHTPQELIDYFQDRPLQFEPGSRFSYSNSNYPLLGAIIEVVSGMSLADYLDKHIFGPLNMNNTSLWYQDNNNNSISKGYRLNAQNEFVEGPAIDGSTVYAAGGIVSTLSDLHTWNMELTNPEHLSKKLVKQLQKEKKTTNNQGTGYGYGFFIEEIQRNRVIQHGGNMYGFTSTALYIPKKEVYVCVLSNRAFDNTKNIARYIASHMINDPIEYYRQLPADKVSDYLGKYKMKGSDEKVIEMQVYEGTLIVFPSDNPGSEVDLYSTDTDTFQSSKIDLKIVFQRNTAGSVIGCKVYQGGVFEFILTSGKK